MLNSYRDTTRQYDDLIDRYNDNCEQLEGELESLTLLRERAQITIKDAQDLVNSIARTPKTITKELKALNAQVRKIPHATSEYEKLKKRIHAAEGAAAGIATGGAAYALSKRGRKTIQKVMESKIPLPFKIAAVLSLLILLLIPFIISKLGTKRTQEKMRELEGENQKVVLLIEACTARIRELEVLQAGLIAQLDGLRHAANSDYRKLDQDTKDALVALVNSAMALAQKVSEDLA